MNNLSTLYSRLFLMRSVLTLKCNCRKSKIVRHWRDLFFAKCLKKMIEKYHLIEGDFFGTIKIARRRGALFLHRHLDGLYFWFPVHTPWSSFPLRPIEGICTSLVFHKVGEFAYGHSIQIRCSVYDYKEPMSLVSVPIAVRACLFVIKVGMVCSTSKWSVFMVSLINKGAPPTI